MQEDEKERRVIVSDREYLRRAVHPEQANECVGFVGGVELQCHRAKRSVPLPLVQVRKTYVVVAVGEMTPPKCALDTVWAFTTKCTRAGEIASEINSCKKVVKQNVARPGRGQTKKKKNLATVMVS